MKIFLVLLTCEPTTDAGELLEFPIAASVREAVFHSDPYRFSDPCH